MMVLKICGVKVSVSLYFYAAVTIVFLLDKSCFASFGILASLLHETAHIVVMAALKIKINEIIFMPVGIKIKRSCKKQYSYPKEIAVLAAGPAANLAISLLIIAVNSDKIYYASAFAAANLVIGIFNFIPVGLLDGGRILELVLNACGRESTSQKICFACSLVFLIPMFIAGTVLWLKSGFNFTLLLTLIYILFFAIKDIMKK